MAKLKTELKNNIEIKHDLKTLTFLQSRFQKLQYSPDFPKKNAFDTIK